MSHIMKRILKSIVLYASADFGLLFKSVRHALLVCLVLNISLVVSAIVSTNIVSANESTPDEDLKPFMAESMTEIIQHKDQQPFILILWSIDCPPCMKELSLLQSLKDEFTTNQVVLVSTDDQDSSAYVQQILVDHQLNEWDNWIFADALSERLRYIIDPDWYGELPRSYFYNNEHQRNAHSGLLNEMVLKAWLKHDVGS